MKNVAQGMPSGFARPLAVDVARRVVPSAARMVAAAAVLVALPPAVHAQDRDFNRYTLEELGGVFVRGEASEACAATGATGESVRLAAEGVLAGAEVEMLAEGEMLRNPALPELRVAVDCAASDAVPGALAYAVSVRALQAVQMIRDNQITLPEAVTWHTAILGVSPAGDARAGLDAAVAEAVGRFAAAYAAINRQAATGGGGAGGQ